MSSRIINAFERIKLRELLAPFLFLLLLAPSIGFRLVNKIKKRQLWLVSEDGEARDNGYHFYKYVRTEHPNDFCFYAVSPKSAGYEKVIRLGNVIKYGGLKHWLYYMSANLNISSQKSGNPCPIFWYFIHVTLGLYRNRVFLQHGVIHNDAEWLHFGNTKFKYFVCSTQKEFSYINAEFGYPRGSLLLAGLPRWDNLKDTSKKEKRKSILIMPTWRNWLGGEKNKMFEMRNFKKTQYYKAWNGLISDHDFINYIENNNIKVYFYPHINMHMFLDEFKPRSKNIEIVSPDNEIQDYLSKCSLMITDYSSVAFDFGFLGKPVIYYQFDKDDYRARQYGEGYFVYEKDGFGPVVSDVVGLFADICEIVEGGFRVDASKTESGLSFNNNSSRLYDALRPKNNLLYSTYALSNGGVERYIITLAKKINIDSSVIVYRGDEDAAIKKQFEKYHVDAVRLPKERLKRMRALKKIIKDRDINLVYACDYYGSMFVVLMAWLLGVRRRIVHSHGTGIVSNFGRLRVFVAKVIISIFSTERFACSRKAGESLFIGRKFSIINNGIDVDKYVFDKSVRKPLRSDMRIDDDCFVIGTVGRLDDNKNQEFMIEIAEYLSDKKYKLVIIGDGENKKKLMDFVQDHGLSEKVRLVGGVNDASKYYSIFDIFVLTSFHEGFPYVLLEAQVNGLPCLVSSTVSEEVKLNENMQFLDLESGPEYWAEVIEKMPKVRIEPKGRILDYSVEKMTENIKRVLEGGREC